MRKNRRIKTIDKIEWVIGKIVLNLIGMAIATGIVLGVFSLISLLAEYLSKSILTLVIATTVAFIGIGKFLIKEFQE